MNLFAVSTACAKGEPQCTVAAYSPIDSCNEMQPLVNAILGGGRQVISERRRYFRSKQDQPKTSTCFVRVFLSATFV